MYSRKFYQERIGRFADTPLVKVLTGIRRVGKSTLMRLFRDELIQRGVERERIIFVDMERIEFADLRTEKELHAYVSAQKKQSSEAHYLFVDEVQEVVGWEKAINSLLNEGGLDIYLTGSNACLLSSELATLLTGRYIEIPVYPLSYGEYLLFRNEEEHREELFYEYLRRGGMPGIHQMEPNDETIQQYLATLVDSIVLKDIVGRYNIRDIELLRRIILFLADNSGHIFSAKRVSDFIKKERRTVSTETVYNYISHLISAFLLYRVSRFDLKGKRFLEVAEKYYLGDLGLKHGLIGFRPSDINTALEMVVFFELKKRGYAVSVGKMGETEVDFVAERGGKKLYIQVCYLLADESVLRRELTPLEAIADNYPKMILSMDRFGVADYEGISRQYLPDFLLHEETTVS